MTTISWGISRQLPKSQNSLTTQDVVVTSNSSLLWNVAKIFFATDPHRVYVQEGHFVDVKIKTSHRCKSEDDVAELFRTFNPLGSLSLPSTPEAPLFVISEAGRPRPRQDSLYSKGMAVAVGGISTKDDVFDLRLRYVVNNIVEGQPAEQY